MKTKHNLRILLLAILAVLVLSSCQAALDLSSPAENPNQEITFEVTFHINVDEWCGNSYPQSLKAQLVARGANAPAEVTSQPETVTFWEDTPITLTLNPRGGLELPIEFDVEYKGLYESGEIKDICPANPPDQAQPCEGDDCPYTLCIDTAQKDNPWPYDVTNPNQTYSVEIFIRCECRGGTKLELSGLDAGPTQEALDQSEEEEDQGSPATTANEYFEIGLAQYEAGDLDKALDSFLSAIELDDQFEEAYVYAGFVYYDLQDYGEALAVFRRAIEINPDYDFAYYGRALVAQQFGENETELSAWISFLEHHPQDDEFRAYANQRVSELREAGEETLE